MSEQLPQIPFKRDGGPIIVDLVFNSGQIMRYTLELWPPDLNAVIWSVNGNNVNTAEDTYALVTPSSTNDGRIVWLTMTMLTQNPGGTYDFAMSFVQDGQSCGSIPGTGPMGAVHVDRSIACKLVATT